MSTKANANLFHVAEVERLYLSRHGELLFRLCKRGPDAILGVFA